MSKCDECGITPAYEGGVFCTNCKPQTNADRIRAMSDEEMAELLNSIQGDAYLVGFNAQAESRYTPYGKNWLDWLREEVSASNI